MALLFMDGFDHYATAEILKKWTGMGTSLGGQTIDFSKGRRPGGGAMIISSNGGWAHKLMPGAYATLIMGFAFWPNSNGDANAYFAEFFESDATHLSLGFNASNQIFVKRGGWNGTVLGTASGALPVAAWSYVEVKMTIHDTAGAVEVRVNGVPVLLLADVDTRQGGSLGKITNVRIGGNLFSYSAGYDDLYVCDTSGAHNNDFLGDVRIDVLVPNGLGTYQDWTPSTGTDHAALVDETTPNTTDYLTGVTPGAKETLTLGDLPAPGSVAAVQVCNYLAKADAGAAKTRNLIRSGTTDACGPEAALSTSYVYSLSVHETDPATGSVWSTAAVNALEVGVEVTQ